MNEWVSITPGKTNTAGDKLYDVEEYLYHLGWLGRLATGNISTYHP